MMKIKSFIQQYTFLGKNFIWRAIQRFLKAFIDFILIYISAQILNQELFGTYNYLLTLIGFFVIFGEFGLSASVNKYIAEFRIRDKEKIQSIISSSVYIFLTLSTIVSLFLLVFNIFIFNFNTLYFIYLILLLFLISASNVFDGIFLGLKKFRTSSLITLFSGIVILPLSYFMISAFAVNGALFIQVLYYLLMTIFLLKYSNFKFLHYDKEFIIKVLRYSIIIGFAGLAYFLYTNIDILILEHFGYIIEIGYYRIIFIVFNLIILPFSLLGQVISPYITEIGTKNEYRRLHNYSMKLWMVFVIGILIAFGSFLGGPIFFNIFFPKYTNAVLFSMWNILLILIPFKLYGAVLTHGFVIPLGHGHITMYLTIIGGVCNVIFDYILIILIGFEGIFYATIVIHSLTITLTAIIFYLLIKKKKKKSLMI